MNDFGTFIRKTRETLKSEDKASYTLRQVAGRVGFEPAYLSKIERGTVPPPSEATIRRLAEELKVDKDMLLAMAGKVSKELQEIIMKRPELFAALLKDLRDAPDHAILKVVREVRDGNW
jgi:transcriptional regulator with XRE-family HTH domain